MSASLEEIYCLWDELHEFGAAQWPGALTHLLERLCALTGASDACWAAELRSKSATAGAQVWAERALRRLHGESGLEAHVRERAIEELMRGAGTLRVHGLGELATPAGPRDALYCALPVTASAEVVVGLYRATAFGPEEAHALRQAMRALRWFHRRVLLGQGLVGTCAELTRTEQRVLSGLLGGESEKVIAQSLGVSYSRTHDHVANIYKKLRVNSRAGLMALWLDQAPVGSPPVHYER